MTTREKILGVVADSDGSLSTRDIAGRIGGISHVAVWKQLKTLEREGAIRRRNGRLVVVGR